MTILIAGTIDIPDDMREQALAEAAALMDDTRSQAGCEHYVWAADPTSPTRVYVFENWDSTEALAAHLAGPYYGACSACWANTMCKMPRSPSFASTWRNPSTTPRGNPVQTFSRDSRAYGNSRD